MIIPFCPPDVEEGEEKLENFQESILIVAELGTQSKRR
jgi:hypothetical protein